MEATGLMPGFLPSSLSPKARRDGTAGRVRFPRGTARAAPASSTAACRRDHDWPARESVCRRHNNSTCPRRCAGDCSSIGAAPGAPDFRRHVAWPGDGMPITGPSRPWGFPRQGGTIRLGSRRILRPRSFPGRSSLYCTRPKPILTRSASEGSNLFPRLRFGLVGNVSFLAA